MSGRAQELLDAATPLPWTVWPREEYTPDRVLTYRQKTVIGAGDLGHWKPTGIDFPDREDAALIVHAVNALPAYEAAVEALERCVEGHDVASHDTEPGDKLRDWPCTDPTIEQARAALARLRDEVPSDV